MTVIFPFCNFISPNFNSYTSGYAIPYCHFHFPFYHGRYTVCRCLTCPVILYTFPFEGILKGLSLSTRMTSLTMLENPLLWLYTRIMLMWATARSKTLSELPLIFLYSHGRWICATVVSQPVKRVLLVELDSLLGTGCPENKDFP